MKLSDTALVCTRLWFKSLDHKKEIGIGEERGAEKEGSSGENMN